MSASVGRKPTVGEKLSACQSLLSEPLSFLDRFLDFFSFFSLRLRLRRAPLLSLPLSSLLSLSERLCLCFLAFLAAFFAFLAVFFLRRRSSDSLSLRSDSDSSSSLQPHRPQPRAQTSTEAPATHSEGAATGAAKPAAPAPAAAASWALHEHVRVS